MHRADHGQGAGGHGVLHLQPAGRAQRGRRRAAAFRHRRRRSSTRTNAHNRAAWPHTMLATFHARHQAQPRTPARGSPRSREMPREWRRALRTWSPLNRKAQDHHRGRNAAPDANEEYLLYQILLGTWPMAVGGRAAARSAFAALSDEEHADLRRAHPGVHDQGHQGGQGQQLLDPAQRGVGRGGAQVHRRAAAARQGGRIRS